MTLLRKHKPILEELADLMEEGRPVKDLIELLEDRIPPPPPEEYNAEGHVANKAMYADE
eukprot:CAMPEP_0170192170 /NCGR_PEP_ID=MMETSP0040_2-20121228/53487_1 /TAXON_ID=641309 /ORGANISM="Lotharella oceanica, Strain CCMP622" /LENGTH=58 /DNA_ID=CAMNT_0010440435 /DNA_START=108 /DNA_END=284 /DNA_ORIENTATION=-